jgi:ABC-type sugar transport system permease subunit
MGKLYYKLPLRHKRSIWGIVFLFPWFLGFVLFFARPFIETIRYAFSDVEVSLTEGIVTTPLGMANFNQAWNIDTHFRQYMFTLAFPTLVMVIIVVIFSLFAAMLINGKYFGRGIVRAVFFIPIIMGANIATAVIVGDDLITQAMSGGDTGAFGGLSGGFFIEVLHIAGIPFQITHYLVDAISGIFQVLAQSGVPILIFLAGLQAIPPSLYEVATIEGSTKYETFWKVTLPMISPMVLLSFVYTVTDLFARHSMSGVFIPRVAAAGQQAQLLHYIRYVGFTYGDYGVASAMAAIYIIATFLVVVLITALISLAVFYYD